MATHIVPAAVFDELARGGGDTLGVARSGQRSKRLLLLHGLQQMARSHAPQLYSRADADASFALLGDAQRRVPHRVDPFLLQPHVAAWAYHCLERLASGRELVADDLGHLGAIAASAALRAGVPFDVTARCRQGEVMFPTFGSARPGVVPGWCRLRSRSRAGGPAGVEITSGADSVDVTFREAPARVAGWLPLRRLRSSVGDVELDVHLDDLDPFRGCGHLPTAGRLSAVQVDDWQVALDQAWSLLVGSSPPSAQAIASGVASLVPLLPADGRTVLSGTCDRAVGAVATTPPQDHLSLAMALAHEFQHTKLFTLLDLVPLLEGTDDAVHYAPWRPDPRPPRGLFQGAYAYLGLTLFWEALRHHESTAAGRARAHFELALAREQVASVLGTLRASGRLTPAGRRFIAGMGKRLAGLRDLPVPSLLGSLARLAAVDNRTGWRLRNLRPDPDDVACWADAWLAGRPGAAPGRGRVTVVDGDGHNPSQARLTLLRYGLRGPGRDVEAPEEATPADVLFVEGRPAQAAAAYRAQLAVDPEDRASWCGLALIRRPELSAVGRALSTCPENVVAVHRAVAARTGGAPDPEEIARWFVTLARPDRG